MAVNEVTSVDVQTLTPFKRFIMTLGELPTSYLESMTYAELVMWFCNFLQEKVIPTVNNNADALQDVIHYLENLDLQDEVDHKLDEMTENGTLQEIVADYLNSKAIFGFDSVADMKLATNFIDGSYARTLGYYNKGDGGSSLYKVRTITNDDTVNEMDIIALYDDTLIAELIPTDSLLLKQFGAKDDEDASSIINHAIEYCSGKNIEIKIDDDYSIESELTVLNNTTIEGNNHIISYELASYMNNMIYIDEHGKNIVLKNIKLDGNEKVKRGIYGIDLQNIFIKNCDIKDLTDELYGGFGIIIYTGSKIKIEDCNIYNIISKDSGVNGGDGILLHNTINCEVNNNIVDTCGRHNLTVSGLGTTGFTEQYDVKITNNYFANSYLCGIDSEAGENIIITNNTFRNNGNSSTNPLSNAISLKNDTQNGSTWYSKKIIVSNNNIKSTNANTKGALFIDNGNGETIIADNIIDVPNNALKLFSGNGAKSLIINGNYIKNCDAGLAIYASYEEHYVVTNNIFDSCNKVLSGSTFRNCVFNDNIIKNCNVLFYGAMNLTYSVFSSNYVEVNQQFTNNQLSLLKTSFTDNTIKYLGDTTISLLFKYSIRNQDLYNKFVGNFFSGDITHVITTDSTNFDESLNGNTYYHIIYDNNMITPA